ncbi:MAG: DUF2252 domain-containing protein, partial [Chloroflexi bacterium]|nr:DUF2252 domain-containing protein [Chloroflexota bacterium]
PQVCPELATAPRVLAVGDLHVENFGTWRDGEGRLVWGVNDFDEAALLPYANDLVRLAVSAKLAIDANQLTLALDAACHAILQGYVEHLTSGGKPFVLAEAHAWLRALASNELREPAPFWSKLDALPTSTQPLPSEARDALTALLPDSSSLAYRVVHRVAGLGSLGRERWTAIADWRGGKIAREAKPLVASAAAWATGDVGASEILYTTILERAVRVPDPLLRQHGNWIVRRLAPDCARIELAMLKAAKDDAHLLRAMARETANVHMGSRAVIARVLADVQARGADWLHAHTNAMAEALHDDWRAWRKAT